MLDDFAQLWANVSMFKVGEAKLRRSMGMLNVFVTYNTINLQWVYQDITP